MAKARVDWACSSSGAGGSQLGSMSELLEGGTLGGIEGPSDGISSCWSAPDLGCRGLACRTDCLMRWGEGAWEAAKVGPCCMRGDESIAESGPS